MADYCDCYQCGEKVHSQLVREWLEGRKLGESGPLLCSDCLKAQPEALAPSHADGREGRWSPAMASVVPTYLGKASNGPASNRCSDGMCGGCRRCLAAQGQDDGEDEMAGMYEEREDDR